jgi:hypothetical protein
LPGTVEVATGSSLGELAKIVHLNPATGIVLRRHHAPARERTGIATTSHRTGAAALVCPCSLHLSSLLGGSCFFANFLNGLGSLVAVFGMPVRLSKIDNVKTVTGTSAKHRVITVQVYSQHEMQSTRESFHVHDLFNAFEVDL